MRWKRWAGECIEPRRERRTRARAGWNLSNKTRVRGVPRSWAIVAYSAWPRSPETAKSAAARELCAYDTKPRKKERRVKNRVEEWRARKKLRSLLHFFVHLLFAALYPLSLARALGSPPPAALFLLWPNWFRLYRSKLSAHESGRPTLNSLNFKKVEVEIRPVICSGYSLIHAHR